MDKRSFFSSVVWFLLAIILFTACQPRPAQTELPATEPPAPSATVPQPTATSSINFSISRDSTKVFFGTANPLSELTGSLSVPFPEGYQVNTDQTGIAVLRGTANAGACTIYVFRTTTLNKTACQPGTYSGSNVSCIEEGSALYNQCSNHIVITPSGVAEHMGTTFSATYLPETQISLFITLDGQVEVTPLRRLGDYEQAIEPIVVKAGEFLYTAPDDHVATISQVPMRVVLPLEYLEPLVNDLDLQVWMDQTQAGLAKQNLPFTILPRQGEPVSMSVTVAGSPLDGPSGVEALAMAAPWAELSDALVQPAGLDLYMMTLDGGEFLNLRDYSYDPDFSREILAGMDYPNGLSATMIYPEGDDALANLAGRLAGVLPKGGISVEVEALPADQIEETMRFRQEMGIPTIWLRLDYPIPLG